MSIGANIKRLRKKQDMTLEDVASIIGVSRQTLSRYETGVIGNIPSDKIELLAAALKTTPSYIMGWESQSAPSVRNILPIPEMRKIPLLGTIACGQPILAEQNVECQVDIPKEIHADFALRCKGDSMINARIFDGDIVYIRIQPQVENGEIAAVRIGEEATLKKVFYVQGADKITLQACNPLFADLVYSGPDLNDIEVLGKAVAFTSAIR